MDRASSVVTPERFAQGMTFEEYMRYIGSPENLPREAGWWRGREVWQLRIGDFRVFYDVDEERQAVIVRAIRRKGTKATEEIL
jgi:ParE-like toxin of type II ParDE toxin-antitoxin system